MSTVTEEMIRDAIQVAMSTGGRPNRGIVPHGGRLFQFERDPKTNKYAVSEID
jgi:hypothetical protein